MIESQKFTCFSTLQEAVQFLEDQVPCPGDGLPDEIFYYISRVTPLVNVDLLVRNPDGRILLAWRNDIYCGQGWHIPGGIVRHQETFEERIRQVSMKELGVMVDFDPTPLATNELIHYERKTRSHFISMLYDCRLPTGFLPDNTGRDRNAAGYLEWHGQFPDNMIHYHAAVYRKFFPI